MTEETDDAATVAAIAVLAACLAAAAHFALGHGGACLAIGGRPTLLTIVQFECSVSNFWIALGGPLISLAVGVGAFLLLKATAEGRVVVRQLLVLVMAINLNWVAGTLLYSSMINGHDWYWILYPIQGPPGPLLRTGEAVAAIAIYAVTILATQRHAVRVAGEASRAYKRLTLSWFAASAAVCGVAFMYAPHRFGNVWGAFWEVGAWSSPLLLPVLRPQSAAARLQPAINREPALIAITILVFVALAATLGRGFPG